MLTSFFQKPLGIATVLGIAVGAPYAAFETDVGTSLRGAASRMVSTNTTLEAPNNSGALPDPYALSAVPNGYMTSAPNGTGGLNPGPDYGYPLNTGYAPNAVSMPGTYPQPLPMDPSMLSVPNAMGTAVPAYAPYLESQRGAARMVPGGTDQLWDNTLGTPSLAQVQQQPGANLGGGTVADLREVLRFDATPGWVTQRFARVSTVLSNVKLDGLRVPLITGTRPSDLAGTLTYYFDASQTMRRINLHGLTGDPTAIANLIVQFYQLKPEQSLGGQLFTSRWNNRVTSMMQISPAPIIYAGADHSKFIVFLELNHPSLDYGLSQEATDLLKQSQATQRW